VPSIKVCRNSVENEKPTETERKEDEKPKEVQTEKTGIQFEDFKDVGEYTSIEEVKAALKEGGLTKQERDELKEQLKELTAMKATYETAMNTNPFIDADLYKLNKIKQEKPEEYDIIRKLVMGGVDGKEVLRLQFIKDNPEYKDKPEKVDLYLNDKYGLDTEYNLDLAEDVKEKELNEMAMEQAVKKAKQELLKEYNTIEVPTVTVTDPEKEKEEATKELVRSRKENRTKWQPVVIGVLENFKSLPITTKDAKGNEVEAMSYEPTAEDKKELAGLVTDYLVENDMPLTEDSKKWASQYATLVFEQKNKAKINQAFAEHIRSMTNEDWIKYTENPSALNDKKDKGAGKGKSKHEQDVDDIMSKHGIV